MKFKINLQAAQSPASSSRIVFLFSIFPLFLSFPVSVQEPQSTFIGLHSLAVIFLLLLWLQMIRLVPFFWDNSSLKIWKQDVLHQAVPPFSLFFVTALVPNVSESLYQWLNTLQSRKYCSCVDVMMFSCTDCWLGLKSFLFSLDFSTLFPFQTRERLSLLRQCCVFQRNPGASHVWINAITLKDFLKFMLQVRNCL